MQYVQLVFTTDQVAELKDGLANVVVDAETEPERLAALNLLQTFLGAALDHPEAFPVTGRMAESIKTRLRRLRGPAQPRPLNRRKKRQEKRMRTAKARRQQRREQVAAFNEARERVEAEVQEILAIHEERMKRADELIRKGMLTGEEVQELMSLREVA